MTKKYIYHFFRTLGAVCDKEGKTEFSLVFHELLKGELSQKLKQSSNITEDILPLDAPYTFPLPRELDVFSFKLSITTKAEWQKWDEEVDTAAALPRDIFACQVFHSWPENLKTVQAKKLMKSNKSKKIFREIAFLAVLNFSPVQKLIFCHF